MIFRGPVQQQVLSEERYSAMPGCVCWTGREVLLSGFGGAGAANEVTAGNLWLTGHLHTVVDCGVQVATHKGSLAMTASNWTPPGSMEARVTKAQSI